MSRTETVIFTNMCMICDGKGNVLVQDRVDPDWSGIAFPGGHVEKGESFTDAVIREVREETGLNVSHLSMCGIKDWVRDDGTRYVVLLYKTSTFDGEPTSSKEGKVFWTPINELSNMKLTDGLLSMLRVFEDESLTEHFFYKENGEWIEVLK